jgi:uncharacterized protein YdbL (DUF1318 family)
MIRFIASATASVLLAAILLTPLGARADALDDAKAQGLVGEQIDGYIGAVSGAGGVQPLIDDINAKRKAKYAEIAGKRGAPPEAVAKIAGQKLIERTPAGQYVRDQTGQWKQK